MKVKGQLIKTVTNRLLIYLLSFLLIICFTIPAQINSYAGTEDFPKITLDVDGKIIIPKLKNYESKWSFNSVIDNNSVWAKIKINKDSANVIKINNNPVYSGDYVYASGLGLGTNIYKVNVDDRNYDLNIYKKHPSEYYNLNDIKISGEWQFDFKPDVYEYNINVATNSTCASIIAKYKNDKTTKMTRYLTIDDKGTLSDNIFDQDGNNVGIVENIPINLGLNKILIKQETMVFDELIDEKTYTLNLTRTQPSNQSNSGGGGGGGSSSVGSTTTLETKIDSNAKAIVISVPQDKLTSLFNLLKENKESVKIAVIEIPKKNDLNNYKIELPVSAFDNKNTSGITLNTNIGSLTLMDTMLQDSLIKSASKVEVNIGNIDKSTLSKGVLDTIGNKPIVSLNVALDGKTTSWNNPNSPVIVSIPYTPTSEELKNPEKIIVYYIDGENNLNVVSNAKYSAETGDVVFSTTHFSTYAIGFNDKNFNDINDLTVKHAIEVLASKGIINGKTTTEFKPKDTITRAEFMTLLTRAFNLNKTFNNNFIDVKSDKYYYEAIGITKSLGIINGVDEQYFNPNGLLTKEHVEIIMNKLETVKGLDEKKVNKALKKISSKVNVTRDEIGLMLYEMIK